MGRAALAAPVAVAALAGCFPSSVVAPEDRSAFLNPEELAWQAYDGGPLDGLYSSVSITGEAGLGLLKVYYCFMPDGSFTGAALLASEPPAFQVLSGAWTLDPDGLRLGEGSPPAKLEQAPDHLRLSGAEGAVVLRREEL
jgi:hypothetical protein